MFKVRIKLVAFLGNQETYPCHMNHKVGDEVIFDGRSYTGDLCPDVWPRITQLVASLFHAGPRYADPMSHSVFWYAPVSVHDDNYRKYDGMGFRNVLKTIREPEYHMANLTIPGAFTWPPPANGTMLQEVTVMCPDVRTSAVFSLEAFDLADAGYSTPYFRRQMSMLDKIVKKPGLTAADISGEFSPNLVMDIYPPLVPEMITPLLDEMELIHFVQREGGRYYCTEAGQRRLEGFKAGLGPVEREALEL